MLKVTLKATEYCKLSDVTPTTFSQTHDVSQRALQSITGLMRGEGLCVGSLELSPGHNE